MTSSSAQLWHLQGWAGETLPWRTHSSMWHKQHKISQEGNEGTSTSPYFYFSVGQSSKGLQGKATPAEAERLPRADTATRPFWCHTHSVTDDGKRGCEEKLSGFDGLSERHFKGEENVQIIIKPISLMHLKMAIIHLMPERKESKNNKKDALAYNCTLFSIKSVALFLPALSWIFLSCKALKLQTGFSPVRLLWLITAEDPWWRAEISSSLHTWTTLEIRTNFKILDNPHFTNKQFYLNPPLKKSCFPEWCWGKEVTTSNFQLYSTSINLSSCQVVGALWSSSSQLPGVSSSSFLLAAWGLALSRLPPYGARYPTPTGCPNADSHLLFHNILIPSCFHGSENAAKEEEERDLQRFWGRWLWLNKLHFGVPWADPTTLSEAPSLPCFHSQRGCLLTWHFLGWHTCTWWEWISILRGSKAPSKLQQLINQHVPNLSLNAKHSPKDPPALPHCRTGTRKRKALSSLSPPKKSFERLTPW